MNNNEFKESECINEVVVENAEKDWNNLNDNDKWEGDPACEFCNEQKIGCMFNCPKIECNKGCINE